MNKKRVFLEGIRDGMPICLGYFAVAFSLGITMRNAGMNATQGFIFSALNMASAGEYAAVQVIATAGTYLEIAIVTLITNARYLLMSAALSQRFSEKTPFIHRLLVGFAITDELFGITINRKGKIDPIYNYGAYSVAIPGWALGTSFGIIAGNILPDRIVSSLSVALFGMFLAIIIPASKIDKVVFGVVLVSFLLSGLSQFVPFFNTLSTGTQVIILTVLIASICAYFFPHEEKEEV